MGKLLVGLRSLSELILTKANQSTFNRECWSAVAVAIALTLMGLIRLS